MKTKKDIKLTHVEHTFSPVWDQRSRILILGTLPSVKSRENNFYYGHPRNRFWKLIAELTGTPIPNTIEEKKAMLLQNRIALWDVVQSCDIHGSSDASISNVVPTDISALLSKAHIVRIYANGATAFQLYNKYCLSDTGQEIIKLPSTSPANAAFGFERLLEEWRQILPELAAPMPSPDSF